MGHKEKRNRPKGFRLRVLAKHEYDGNLRVSQAIRANHPTRAVLQKWFSTVILCSHKLAPFFWVFVKFL
jgi:hypothetical protein